MSFTHPQNYIELALMVDSSPAIPEPNGIGDIQQSSGLYPRLLGERWIELDEIVRSYHEGTTALRCQGVFTVRYEKGWIPRVLAWFSKLPPEGNAVTTELRVMPSENGSERWHRSFDGHVLESEQSEVQGQLEERFGKLVSLRLRFELKAVDRALIFETVGVRWAIGRFKATVPWGLAPVVRARVGVAERAYESVGVRVEFSWRSRSIGSYEGILFSRDNPS